MVYRIKYGIRKYYEAREYLTTHEKDYEEVGIKAAEV
jgi:hypothetical protein